MESAEGSVRYIIRTYVTQVQRETQVTRVTMVNNPNTGDKEAHPEIADLGWFVLFAGSHEKLFLGDIEPPLKVGDKIRITIEKDL